LVFGVLNTRSQVHAAPGERVGSKSKLRKNPMKKLLALLPVRAALVGAAAVTMLAAAAAAQAAPKFDLVAGSGTWDGGGNGTPTLHVNASDRNKHPQFTIEYAAPRGTTIHGPITDWSVTGNSNKGNASACLTGLVKRSNDAGFVVSQYVPIAIAKKDGVWRFNFGPSRPDRPSLCSIAPNLVFDSADFTIFDAR
jgi:hypothetical protein